MKLISWNLGAAYGRWHQDADLHERSWKWLADADPDLALLQETRPPRWVRDQWSLYHLPYQLFASAIIARREYELTEVPLDAHPALKGFGAYLATVQLAMGTVSPMVVASVHTSAKRAPEWGHPGLDGMAIARRTVGEPWWNDVAFAAYAGLVGDARFLVGGDWNTSRYVDTVGVPSSEGAEFFDRAARSGWMEISLDETGNEGKTWYGSPNPRPYQPDHVFVDSATAKCVRSFSIDPTPAELGLSDHAPLVVDLSPLTV